MPQVVEARPAGALIGEADRPNQSEEGGVDILVVQAGPGA